MSNWQDILKTNKIKPILNDIEDKIIDIFNWNLFDKGNYNKEMLNELKRKHDGESGDFTLEFSLNEEDETFYAELRYEISTGSILLLEIAMDVKGRTRNTRSGYRMDEAIEDKITEEELEDLQRLENKLGKK